MCIAPYLIEAGARALAERRVLQNLAIDRRPVDPEMVARSVEYAWRDFAEAAEAVIKAERAAQQAWLKEEAAKV